jgi:hypothetical protein
MKKPTAMLLRADFDIDQVGQTLEWSFTRKDGDGNPITGKYAGEIYFTVGEKMKLHVKAGSKTPFKGFVVKDCVLISRPGIACTGPKVPTVYSPPSPFVGNDRVKVPGASINIPVDQFVPVQLKQTGATPYYEMAQEWSDHLMVGETTGRWELSMVLTVCITREDNSTVERVLCFDPEGTVGAGTSPP